MSDWPNKTTATGGNWNPSETPLQDALGQAALWKARADQLAADLTALEATQMDNLRVLDGERALRGLAEIAREQAEAEVERLTGLLKRCLNHSGHGAYCPAHVVPTACNCGWREARPDIELALSSATREGL